jgi:streptomycin 6-kinase
MITVPEEFARTTTAREGAAGRAWIAALPGVVAALCARWDLTVDGAPMHGYQGVVVPVRRGAEPGALKVSWRTAATADEAAALAAWDGQGAARLHAAAPEVGGLWMERLDTGHSLDDLPVAEALRIAGGLLRRLAIPAPAGFRALGVMAADIARTLPARWEQFGRPMPRRTLDAARDLAAQLGPAAGRLLVNYDLHYADVLASAREPWLVVDPMVVVGDPEFGVAQLLWRRLEEQEAQGGPARHFSILVEAAALDEPLARAWTLVRCVDYWLWGLSVGLTYDPARCARILDWLQAAGRP